MCRLFSFLNLNCIKIIANFAYRDVQHFADRKYLFLREREVVVELCTQSGFTDADSLCKLFLCKATLSHSPKQL